MKRTLCTGLMMALFLAPAISAAPDILPGLWENKVEVSSASGMSEQQLAEARKMMEGLPPEQQEMMKNMMARRGVSFDFGSSTIQTCLTQERIDRFDIAKTDERCTQSFEEKSDNHYTVTMKCDNQNMSGHGDYIIEDEKNYTGTTVMDVNINGQQDTITMKQEGRWLASDCGDVTPDQT